MSGRRSLLCLGASVVAHGGLLALLFFFFVSDESFSSPLIIDLSALDATSESASKLETRSERPATAGVRGSRAKRAGSEPSGERVAAAPALPMPASPTVVTPAPELVRPPEREVPVSKPEPREPEPSPALAAPREPAAAREPVQDAAPTVTTSPVTGTNPAGTVGSSADGATGTPSSATSGGAPGGSGSRLALAPGGTGGEPGSEYGGYLAGVRRRIQESIQYPTSARRRGVKGTVNLEILIRADGAISSVSVAGSSTHSELDEAAVEAVRSLSPQPFPAGLKPRPLRVKLPIVFDLQ
jgi:periplasmic protein TonB